jgi:oligoendopeptidase F
MEALALGGTATLPELYATAGIEFNFSDAYVASLADFVRSELELLQA